MPLSAKEEFAARLVEALLDSGHRSSRNAKSGVDVGPLAKHIKVTREMARRYTEGRAVPDLNKMKLMAEWLGVRLPWLRDGDGPKHERRTEVTAVAQQLASYDALSNEAKEVAIAWSRLSPDTRVMMRDVMFMLSLAERRFPWLRRGRPEGETYDQWERRQEQNFTAMGRLEQDRKARVKQG